MNPVAQVTNECGAHSVINQAKWVKPLWNEGLWLKQKYREAWQVDCITLPQTCVARPMCLQWQKQPQDGWKLPVPCGTAWNTVLRLGNKVLESHSTSETVESDNGTHF